MKKIVKFAIALAVIGGAAAQASLIIVNSNVTATVGSGSRFTNADIGTVSDNSWEQRTGASWSMSGGALVNAGDLGTTVDDQGAHLLNTVSSTDTSLTEITVSFDYSVGQGSTMYFSSSLFTGAVGTLSGRLTNTAGGWYANDFDGQFTSAANLKDGTNPTGTTGAALISFVGGTSGTFSQTYDISGYSAAGISDITDVSHFLAVFTADTAADGDGAMSVDNFNVTAIPEPATIGMLGLGAAGLIAFRRRMRG